MKAKETRLRDEVINAIIIVSKVNKKEISDHIQIRNELGIDSLMMMEILANIETHYNILLNEEKLLKLKTVGEFLDYVVEEIKNNL